MSYELSKLLLVKFETPSTVSNNTYCLINESETHMENLDGPFSL